MHDEDFSGAGGSSPTAIDMELIAASGSPSPASSLIDEIVRESARRMHSRLLVVRNGYRQPHDVLTQRLSSGSHSAAGQRQTHRPHHR